MRWQVVLIVALTLIAIGLEQSPVVGQMFGQGVARACGGCGVFGCKPGNCRQFGRMQRRLCKAGCNSGCSSCVPMPMQPSCATPALTQSCATPMPLCPTYEPVYETRMYPRQVVGCTMVPKTVCRQEAYCETVPVTTYRQVVITVPQTEYRQVVRHRTVADQVMVPQKTVNTVWEQKVHCRYRAVYRPPVITPALPACTDGCADMGLGGFNPGLMGTEVGPAPHVYQQPGLSVPGVPSMTPSHDHGHQVPAPMGEPSFKATPKDNNQSFYSPWQAVPRSGYGHHGHDHGHHHGHNHTAHHDGFRTLNTDPRTAYASPRFVPAPSASTVWYSQQR